MAGHTRESLAFNHILQAMNIPCRILRDFRLMLAGNLFVTRCWVQPRNVQLLNLGDRSHRTVIDYCRLKLSTMFFPTVTFYRGTIPKSTCSSPSGTVDGQNPAPPRMMIIPLFIGFYISHGGCWGINSITKVLSTAAMFLNSILWPHFT